MDWNLIRSTVEQDTWHIQQIDEYETDSRNQDTESDEKDDFEVVL